MDHKQIGILLFLLGLGAFLVWVVRALLRPRSAAEEVEATEPAVEAGAEAAEPAAKAGAEAAAAGEAEVTEPAAKAGAEAAEPEGEAPAEAAAAGEAEVAEPAAKAGTEAAAAGEAEVTEPAAKAGAEAAEPEGEAGAEAAAAGEAEAAEPAPEPGEPGTEAAAEGVEAPEAPEAPPAPTSEAAPAPEPAAASAPPAEAAPAPAVPMPKPKPKAEPKPKPVPAGKPRKELRAGLAKTRRGFVSRIGDLFRGKREIDASVMDELEEVLFTADIGVKTSEKLFSKVKEALDRKALKDADAVWSVIKAEAVEILRLEAPPIDLDADKPFILLMVGVNGVGKTTTIGKLAAQFGAQGKRVLLAAGDTFRAAAVEQLEVWGQRVGAPVVKGKEGQDPSSVIFDAIKRAKQEGFDVVICDTAGRLHTKVNLMEELQKIHRVAGKAHSGAPHEVFLVLDATTGQNAIAQANLFREAVSISGVVLTKLDGTAKGGIILGICDEMQIPVRYIGIGEGVEDLRPFVAEEFVEALFAPADADA